MALSARIMHRWRQRMDGTEIAVLFSVSALVIFSATVWHSGPLVETITAAPIHNVLDDGLVTLVDLAGSLLASAVGVLLLAGLSRISRRARYFIIPALSIGRATPGLGLLGLGLAILPPEITIILVAASGLIWGVTTALLDAEELVPPELERVAQALRLTGWQRFWRLQMPTAIPLVLDRAAASLPGLWFRLLCAQALVLFVTHRDLGGLGVRAAHALVERSPLLLLEAALAFLALIWAFDQVLTRPVLSWSQRYRLSGPARSGRIEEGRVLRAWRRLAGMRHVNFALWALAGGLANLRLGRVCRDMPSHEGYRRQQGALVYPVLAITLFFLASWHAHVLSGLPMLLLRGVLTLSHVCEALLLAALVWIPAGLLLGQATAGTRRCVRYIAVLGALFPAVLLYPLFRAFGALPPAVMLFLGGHWLVGIAVLDSARGVPPRLEQVVAGLGLRGPLLWRRVLFPLMAPDLCGGFLIAAIPLWNVVMIAEFFSSSGAGLGVHLLSQILSRDLAAQVPALTLLVLFSLLLDRLILQPMAVHVAQKYMLP